MAGKLQRDLILDKIRGLGLASGCTIGDDSIKCLLCNISFSDISQDKNFPIKALKHFGSLQHFNAGKWRLLKNVPEQREAGGQDGDVYYVQFEVPPKKWIDDFFSTDHDAGPSKKRSRSLSNNSTSSSELDLASSAPNVSVGDDEGDVELSFGNVTDQATMTENCSCICSCKAERNNNHIAISTNEELSLLSAVIGTNVTVGSLKNLEKYEFLKSALKDIFAKKPFQPHDKLLSSTVAKFSLKYGVSAGKDLSNLFGGPKRSKIFELIRPKLRVLPFYDEKNVEKHLITVKGSILNLFCN